MTGDIRSYAEFTTREIEDDEAFKSTLVDSMVWHPLTSEQTKTMVIGNARRAWHKALEWERKRTAQPTPDAVAEHVTAMVEGLSHSSIGQEILRTAFKGK